MTPEYPKPEEVEKLKVGISNYLLAEVFPAEELKIHLILASADSRHTVATVGEDAIRRAARQVNFYSTNVTDAVWLCHRYTHVYGKIYIYLLVVLYM